MIRYITKQGKKYAYPYVIGLLIIYRRGLIEFSFSPNIDCKLGFNIGGQEHIHNNQGEGKLEHDKIYYKTR